MEARRDKKGFSEDGVHMIEEKKLYEILCSGRLTHELEEEQFVVVGIQVTPEDYLKYPKGVDGVISKFSERFSELPVIEEG